MTPTLTVVFSSNYRPYVQQDQLTALELFRFTGELYDTVKGLYYMGARFYDPSTGRFVTEDSYLGSNEDPKSRDRYDYAEDDPEKNRDRPGLTQFGLSETMFICMFKHISFMVKTLTIRDEVYERLVAVKDADESFSDLFTRLVEQGSSVEALRRLRGKVVFTDKRRMLAEISARREEKRA